MANDVKIPSLPAALAIIAQDRGKKALCSAADKIKHLGSSDLFGGERLKHATISKGKKAFSKAKSLFSKKAKAEKTDLKQPLPTQAEPEKKVTFEGEPDTKCFKKPDTSDVNVDFGPEQAPKQTVNDKPFTSDSSFKDPNKHLDQFFKEFDQLFKEPSGGPVDRKKVVHLPQQSATFDVTLPPSMTAELVPHDPSQNEVQAPVLTPEDDACNAEKENIPTERQIQIVDLPSPKQRASSHETNTEIGSCSGFSWPRKQERPEQA